MLNQPATIKSRPTNGVSDWIDYRLPVLHFFVAS